MANGKKIKEMRKKRGLSQRDLAKKAEISASYLSLIESGVKQPKELILIALADALHVSLDYLTDRSDEPTISKNSMDTELIDQIDFIIKNYEKSKR